MKHKNCGGLVAIVKYGYKCALCKKYLNAVDIYDKEG